MAISPLHNATDVVTYQIALDGTILPDNVEVISIKVEHQLNYIPQAIIEIKLPDRNRSPFDLSESERFEAGTPITISAGYHSRNAVIFTGLVSGQGVNGGIDHAVLTIHCEHKAALMDIVEHTASFNDRTNADIITLVCEENGIDVEIEDTEQLYPNVLQKKQTDWDFIVQRAMLSNLLLVCEDNKVMAQKQALASEPDLKLTFRRDVQEFDLALDQSSLLKTSEAKTTKVPTKVLRDKRKQRTVAPYGTLDFQGSALARLNTPIELAGFGKLYSGKQLISGVYHTIEAKEWITSVEIGLNILSYLEVVEEEGNSNEETHENEQQAPAILEYITYDEATQELLIKDPHENEIKLSNTGISIKSQSDLHLESTGSIFLDAGANINANAAASLQGEGANITFAAQAEYKAEGAASAELSAGGITTIKGSLVNIN